MASRLETRVAPPTIPRVPLEEAASIVGRAMRLYAEGQLGQLRELVHPEAEIQMLFLDGELAHGPDGLVAALQRAADSIHTVSPVDVEPIDSGAAILIGRILREVPRGGLADDAAAWLNVIRDGLLWRVLVYGDVAEARHAYETRFSAEALRALEQHAVNDHAGPSTS